MLLFALVGFCRARSSMACRCSFSGKASSRGSTCGIDKALEGGLNLGAQRARRLLKDLTAKADAMALRAFDAPAVRAPRAAECAARAGGCAGGDALYRSAASSSRTQATSARDRARASGRRGACASCGCSRPMRRSSAIPERGLYLRVMVPVNVVSLTDEARALQLMQPVPEELGRDAETVQTGYRDYQELLFSRRGLKRLYGITLTLTLLLALLSALAASFLLSERLSAPLSVLVEGTRAVAQGDFSQRAADPSRDELGMLTRSFNSMTLQLAEARATGRTQGSASSHTRRRISKASWPTCPRACSRSTKPGAALGESQRAPHPARSTARRSSAASSAPGMSATRALAPVSAGAAGGVQHSMNGGNGSMQVEREARDGTRCCCVRGSRLPAGAETGYVVVFDDVTHLLQAQRDAAWAEVARRLAHEIKNPLTPIQLSAERLRA